MREYSSFLCPQLCLTLCHLTLFLDGEDTDAISDLIPAYAESCREYIIELKRRNENTREKIQPVCCVLRELIDFRIEFENETKGDDFIIN